MSASHHCVLQCARDDGERNRGTDYPTRSSHARRDRQEPRSIHPIPSSRALPHTPSSRALPHTPSSRALPHTPSSRARRGAKCRSADTGISGLSAMHGRSAEIPVSASHHCVLQCARDDGERNRGTDYPTRSSHARRDRQEPRSIHPIPSSRALPHTPSSRARRGA